jgi:hypothetical protein
LAVSNSRRNKGKVVTVAITSNVANCREDIRREEAGNVESDTPVHTVLGRVDQSSIGRSPCKKLTCCVLDAHGI